MDWLLDNQESCGYNSVVRGGAPDETGWCRLLDMNETAGVAVWKYVMPLTPDHVGERFT